MKSTRVTLFLIILDNVPMSKQMFVLFGKPYSGLRGQTGPLFTAQISILNLLSMLSV